MQSAPGTVESTVHSSVIDVGAADASAIPPEQREALRDHLARGAGALFVDMVERINEFFESGAMANELGVHYEPPTVKLTSQGWLCFEQNFRVL